MGRFRKFTENEQLVMLQALKDYNKRPWGPGDTLQDELVKDCDSCWKLSFVENARGKEV